MSDRDGVEIELEAAPAGDALSGDCEHCDWSSEAPTVHDRAQALIEHNEGEHPHAARSVLRLDRLGNVGGDGR